MRKLLNKFVKNKKYIFVVLLLSLILIFAGLKAQEALATWGRMNNKTQGSENISPSTTYNNRGAIIKLYNDEPRVVWLDNAFWEVYYTQWNGTTWTRANNSTAGYQNISNTPGVLTDEVRMQLDANGYPQVVFDNHGSNEIYYTRWDGTKWATADGTAGKEAISDINTLDIDFQLDSNYRPQVVWSFESGDFEIYFTKWNGSDWTYADGSTSGYEQVSSLPDNAEEIHPSLLIYNNNPRIIAGGYDNTDQIDYIQWSGSDWTYADGITSGWENIAGISTDTKMPQMQLDSDGHPHIVWSDDNGAADWDLSYTQWNGNKWTKADGTTEGFENVHDNASSSYLCSDVAFKIGETFELDSQDRPRIVWRDNADGNYDIYYTQWSGTQWTKANGTAGYENISNQTEFAYNAKLRLTTNDIPIVTWSHNTASSEVYLTQWTVGAGESVCGSGVFDCWTTPEEIVSGVSNVSSNSGDSEIDKLELTSANLPYVLWHDDTDGNYDIYFSRWLYDQSGAVDISANVEPSLTVNLSAASCDLGSFTASAVKTCNYYSQISTNGTTGYIAYIKEDGDLRNATNSISDVADNEVTAGSVEYGVATNDSDYATLDIDQQVTDCAGLNNGSAAPAVALTTSDQSYAKATGPVSADEVYLCHAVAISGTTPAGAYSSTITITIVSNY